MSAPSLAACDIVARIRVGGSGAATAQAARAAHVSIRIGSKSVSTYRSVGLAVCKRSPPSSIGVPRALLLQSHGFEGRLPAEEGAVLADQAVAEVGEHVCGLLTYRHPRPL